jgi:hypothetical protein
VSRYWVSDAASADLEEIWFFTAQDDPDAADLPLPHSPFCLRHSALRQVSPVLAQNWPKTGNNSENMPVDSPTPLCQYRAMLGETQKQFSLTRAAFSTCGGAKTNFQ